MKAIKGTTMQVNINEKEDPQRVLTIIGDISSKTDKEIHSFLCWNTIQQ